MKAKPHQHTILWADDDSDDLFIVKEIIHSSCNNHNVIEVNNGREAIDYLHSIDSSSNVPCLVVLDINMPLMNGKDTLVSIKNEPKFASISLVVFTTSESEKDRNFCERYGVKMFSKPHTYQGFKRMIEQLLTLCQVSNHSQLSV
ncbi:MAG: response regulator [Chitinophagaceae bacterium]|nr:MAG: response regulator [Chitinophagaceae bacterium]